MKILFPLLFLYLVLNQSCGSKGSDNPDFDKDIDTAHVQLTYVDTLRLHEGEMPSDWTKINLFKGFYIGFPKQPSYQVTGRHKDFEEYKLKKKDYILYVSLRNLSKDSTFEANRDDRTAYYYAVTADLAESIDYEDMKSNIVSQKSYFALKVYEGLESEIKAPDVQIFIRCVLIGELLYTMAFIVWVKPNPAMLQLKDRFFYSFGKELYIE